VPNCFGGVASASEIGSRVVSGVDLYSIVKELVGTAGQNAPRAGPQNSFWVVPERDQGTKNDSILVRTARQYPEGWRFI
jgi:hypothetical protein